MQFHKIETYRIRICLALIVIGKLRPIKWVQYDTFFDCTRLSYQLYKAYRDNSFTRSDLTITQSKLHVDILGFWEFPECVNQVGSICLSVVLPCLVNFGFLLRDSSLWLRVRWWWVGRIGVFYYIIVTDGWWWVMGCDGWWVMGDGSQKGSRILLKLFSDEVQVI